MTIVARDKRKMDYCIISLAVGQWKFTVEASVNVWDQKHGESACRQGCPV